MTDLYKSRPVVWTLFFIFSVVWFYTLGVRTLVPTDEGRYAEMAREMVATGDWITTRLNGIKYFEKPPLQTWMNALTFGLFGLGEWQARLWTGLCGFLGVVLVSVTGRKVFNPRVGFYAGLILASSFLWAALGHINTLDMGLSGMMTLALCALLIAQRDNASPTERRNWMLACWAGMALAVMSKGLIGLVLPGAVLVIYTLIARDWAIWRRLHLVKGLCVFFAITTPWFVLVSLKNPEFPHFFFIHEHFQRFLTKVHHREGPWYYFIPLLIMGIVPWLAVLVQGVVQGLRENSAGAFKPKRLLVVWAGFIFFFFSISSSKLPSYILPIFPALALLLAAYLDTASRKTWMATAGLVMATGAAAIPFVPRISKMASLPQEAPLLQAYQSWVMAACITALIGGALALWLANRARRDWTAVTLAATGFICGQLLTLGTEPHGNYRAGLPMVPAIAAELTPQTTLYGLGLYDQTLPFYLRRTMILVEHQDELEFGLSQEPQRWIPNREDFIKQWTTGPKAVAITRPEIYADLQKRGIPMRVITQDGRRIAITNDVRK
jgi:4-amino-4-deoxy-L-arabinose transferase-like glycosyltransferase